MKTLSVASIYAVIATTTYLWIVFFFSDGDAVPFLPNSLLTLAIFALFVSHLSWQLMPKVSVEIRNRVLQAVLSVLFIPLLIICFAHVYRDIGIEDARQNSDYIYFSVVTFTTLGYGDLSPAGSAKTYAMLQAISGFLFVPLLISQLINTTKEAGDDIRRREEELAQIREIIERND